LDRGKYPEKAILAGEGKKTLKLHRCVGKRKTNRGTAVILQRSKKKKAHKSYILIPKKKGGQNRKERQKRGDYKSGRIPIWGGKRERDEGSPITKVFLL